jgi:hypothetical protein
VCSLPQGSVVVLLLPWTPALEPTTCSSFALWIICKVWSAMLHVLRARWTVCKGASIPLELSDSYTVGSRMDHVCQGGKLSVWGVAGCCSEPTAA